MNTKAVPRTLFCIALLTLASSLFAAEVKPHQSITKGSNIVHQAPAPPPGVSVLYSNLGPKNNAYNGNQGWTIAGPQSALGFDQAIAQPYTPAADSTIQGLQLGLGYVEGANTFAVAIFTDASGLPGKPIKVWNATNIANFGTCCTLATVVDKAGIKVTAGTQYWVVVGWDNASETLYGVWDQTYNGSQGTVAFASTGNGNVWETFTGTQSAYAIYGTTP
jgi:hypothetical protein